MTPPPQPENDRSENEADNELLGRLSLAIADADPPPDGLADVAMRALTWDVELGLLAGVVDAEPVLVRDSSAGRGLAAPTEKSFEIDDYAIDVAVESAQTGSVVVRGIVTPPVDRVFFTGPAFSPRPVECDEYGRFEAEVAISTVAVEFIGSDDLARRTPLLDL